MLDPWLASLSDPLFRLPLLVGLLLAALLPVIGALLMLRDEWLAALGLAHVAAASALLGNALGLPTLIGGTAGALAGGALKTRFEARGNVAYAFMILVGWSATLLIGANTELGERLAHALVEGQLYFAGVSELIAALALIGAALWILPRILPQLLRSRFFPRFEQANALPAWRWHLRMDLLAAASLAIGTLSVGLMGAFALVLIPAWVTFQIAPSWRWTLIGSGLVGVTSYLAAFALALQLDQPFGPMMVAVLVGIAAIMTLLRSWPGSPSAS
ncbi:ABC transporter [Thiorhodococcus mannitoliphagus]|uniref:ABC transporter n=1 Tax=Thiorhodococcus mannitoliphagus TaxID=329406 RepID=A0A6P1E4X1_9GAMM|nr:metal ABC transporter permease [Thiorhodococcus mannitoliphagus]NEX23074.1 ABC transporter [Thiorhodococcus mannitoliphagus]